MKKTLLLALALMMMPVFAFAQTSWNFEGAFWPQVLTDSGINSGHGIAVDPDGKVWFQAFSASDSVQVPELGDAYFPVRVIHIFNSDGTTGDFSPLKFIDFAGGARDTLGGFVTRDSNNDLAWEGRSGRGLRADHNGNILISAFNTLYRVNYQDGMGMNKADFPDYCALAAPAADANGNTFVAPVCPGPPIRILDEDFNFVENARDLTVGFSRSFEVSADGNTVYWAGYTNHAVAVYHRPDEFSPFDSTGVILEGFDSESLTFNPVTGHLWASAGSPNDLPNRYDGVTTNWMPQTWYSFDPSDWTTALASITWDGGGDGRPRGLAFSPDGMTAYVTQFNQLAPSVQQFSGTATSIERVEGEVPSTFTLHQSYPNPFNPQTTIRFDLEKAGHAQLRVFDSLGRQVAELVNGSLGAGTYDYTFEAGNLPSGTYIYFLEFDGQRQSGKMTLLK